jgi:predicted kinase
MPLSRAIGAAAMNRGVVVLSGPPCSGKSEVGRILGADWERAGWHYVNVDAIFNQLLPGSTRTMSDRMLAYDAAHAVARSLFEQGRVPILECTYSRRQQRASLAKALAGTPSVLLWVVEFSVPADEAVQRYRGSSTHQATDLTEQLVRERARTFPYSHGAQRLRSDLAPPPELARQVAAWLRGNPVPIDPDRWASDGK